jgi:hypothetical protein
MAGNPSVSESMSLLPSVNDLLVDRTLLLVLLLGFGKGKEPLVPFGLQSARHQAIVGINVHESLQRKVDFVTGAFDLLLA